VAYLDLSHEFSQNSALSAASPQGFLPDSAPLASFDHLEWLVINLARHDTLETLREPRQRSWFGRLIFGRQHNYALSGQRLEALRRLAVEVWHRPHAVSIAALADFEAAGFTKAHVPLLLTACGASPETPESVLRAARNSV
jgi:hypothetical protein